MEAILRVYPGYLESVYNVLWRRYAQRQNAHVHKHTALFGDFACLAREHSSSDSRLC